MIAVYNRVTQAIKTASVALFSAAKWHNVFTSHIECINSKVFKEHGTINNPEPK